MERIKIKVDKREEVGKQIAKKLRQKGYVPAIVYSEDTNIALSIPPVSLKLLRSIHFSESTIIDMEIADGGTHKVMPVLIKDIQFHPLTEAISHIDFLKVSLKEKIKVHLPVILKGEAKGVKEEGGIVEQVLRELEVEGLPLDIPEKIEVDISELEIGKSLHVEDLSVPGNLKVITDKETPVVTVVVKKEEEMEAVTEEAPPEEPEVIKEKKEISKEELKEGKEERSKGKEKEEEKKGK